MCWADENGPPRCTKAVAPTGHVCRNWWWKYKNSALSQTWKAIFRIRKSQWLGSPIQSPHSNEASIDWQSNCGPFIIFLLLFWGIKSSKMLLDGWLPVHWSSLRMIRRRQTAALPDTRATLRQADIFALPSKIIETSKSAVFHSQKCPSLVRLHWVDSFSLVTWKLPTAQEINLKYIKFE